MCQILKISATCYNEILFLTLRCSKVLQYFIISIFLFTLSRALRPSLFLVSLSLSSEPSIALQNMPPSYSPNPHSLSSLSSSQLSPSSLSDPNTVPPPSDYPPISALSPYPHAAFDLVLSVHSFPFHCLSCALSPLLLTLSFIFSLPLCFPFSLHLDFMGLRCGGVAKMRCWVWLGCSGFSWIVGLYSGVWWVSVMVR